MANEVRDLVPEVTFVIGETFPEATAAYRERKVRETLRDLDPRHLPGPGEIREIASQSSPRIPLAPPAERPSLDPRQEQAIARYLECVRRDLRERFPLLPGETAAAEDASFLTAGVLGAPERSAVLHQRTNMADLYFILPSVQVGAAGNLAVKSVVPAPDTEPRTVLRGESTVKSAATFVATNLLSGALSAVGGALANLLIEKLFPPGVPDYFDEVYKEISKRIGQALQQSTIDQINGALRNIESHLTTEYTPKRESSNLAKGADRKALFGLLQKYDSTFLSGPGGMLGTLKDDKYALAGFPAFQLAGTLQLVLFQEMANVDPSNLDGGVPKPANQSSYGRPKSGTVALAAKEFAGFANATWPKLEKARREGVTWSAEVGAEPAGKGMTRYFHVGVIKDAGEEVHSIRLGDKQKDDRFEHQGDLEAWIDNYRRPKVARLSEQLDFPSFVANLQKLIDQPILPK